jgi:hypothetical protein
MVPPFHVVGGLIPSTVVTTSTYYGVWVCNTPGGYTTNVYLGNLATEAPNIVEYLEGLYTSTQALADCTASCQSMTAAELAYAGPLEQQYRPLALVAFNGASTTRSVYGLNSDGTLNPTAITNETVAVAAHCDETARIVTAPTYYSVAGVNDQNGKPLPAGTYAICVVSLPIGSN